MKLIKNYFYNVGYQIFVLIVPLITVPYVSRVLGREGVGINAYTNSIVHYFVLFGSIGINLYGNRAIAYCREDLKKRSKVFFEIAFLKIICIFFSYLIFLAFLLFVNQYKIFYLYQSLFIIAAGLDISWFFMGIEDFKKTVLRNGLIKLISLIAVFIFVKDSSDLKIYIFILSLSTLLGNLLLWPYLRKLVNKVSLKEINVLQHFFPSLTLFVPQIATQIYLVLNKTMLGSMTGVVSAGYYEQSDKIIKIILAIVTATGTVMLPRMAHTFAKGDKKRVDKYLVTSFDFVSFICFPMSLGLAAIAPKFSVWFLGQEFAITGELIPILSLVIIFIGWSNVLGTQYLLPTNKTKYYSVSVISGAVFSIILNLFLIPLFGVYGATIATVISEFIVTFIQVYYVKKEINLIFLFKEKWKYLLGSLIMFFIVRTLNLYLKGTFVSFLIQIFIGGIIYLVSIFIMNPPIIKNNKKYFISITNKLKGKM